MKTVVKITLIVGMALLLVGGTICSVAVAVSPSLRKDWSWRGQMGQYGQAERKEYSFDASAVKGLRVEEISGSVIVVPSREDQVTVTCYDSEQTNYEVKLDASGTLVIKNKIQRNWMWRLAHLQLTTDGGFSPLTIEVPETLGQNLNIDSVSADVSVSGLKVQGDLRVDTASGDVQVEDCEISGNLTVNTVSGDVKLHRSSVAAQAKIDGTSSEVNIGNSTLGKLNINLISGDTNMTDVTVTGRASVSTTSGELLFQRLAVQELDVDVISGNVGGTIVGDAEDYTIRIDTLSGDRNIPRSGGGAKKISVDSLSGDVDIDFVS